MKFYILFFTILLLSACDGSYTSTSQESESSTFGNEVVVDQATGGDRPHSQLPPPYTRGDIRFEHITVEEGLSQNGAYSIIQDSKGFMWFGTQDGLNKYDGTSFTVYKHDPENSASISDNWIWTILEDRQGTLWIGTLSGGLNSYDRELDQFT
jgi:hypothetical protein